MIKKTLKKIAVQEIDLGDDLYRYSSTQPAEPLMLSIERIGLVNPPVVQQKAGADFRIVCGFKRMATLVALRSETVSVFVVADSQPSLDLFLLAIQDNQSIRALDPVELATIFAKLESTFGITQENIVASYLPLLGFGQNPRVLQIYHDLHRLTDEWHDALRKDLISLDFAQEMLNHSAAERQRVLSLIFNLRLGKNRQREFIKLLTDVARLDQLSLLQLMDSQPVRAIEFAEKQTPSQKAERLKEWLWEKRYPTYTKIKKQCETLLRQAHLPPNLTIQAPAFFESDVYTAGFTFASQDEFAKSIAAFSNILDRGLVKKITGLL